MSELPPTAVPFSEPQQPGTIPYPASLPSGPEMAAMVQRLEAPSAPSPVVPVAGANAPALDTGALDLRSTRASIEPLVAASDGGSSAPEPTGSMPSDRPILGVDPLRPSSPAAIEAADALEPDGPSPVGLPTLQLMSITEATASRTSGAGDRREPPRSFTFDSAPGAATASTGGPVAAAVQRQASSTAPAFSLSTPGSSGSGAARPSGVPSGPATPTPIQRVVRPTFVDPLPIQRSANPVPRDGGAPTASAIPSAGLSAATTGHLTSSAFESPSQPGESVAAGPAVLLEPLATGSGQAPLAMTSAAPTTSRDVAPVPVQRAAVPGSDGAVGSSNATRGLPLSARPSTPGSLASGGSPAPGGPSPSAFTPALPIQSITSPAVTPPAPVQRLDAAMPLATTPNEGGSAAAPLSRSIDGGLSTASLALLARPPVALQRSVPSGPATATARQSALTAMPVARPDGGHAAAGGGETLPVQRFIGAAASIFFGVGRRPPPKPDSNDPATSAVVTPPAPPAPVDTAAESSKMLASVKDDDLVKFAARLVPHLAGPLAKTPELTHPEPFTPDSLTFQELELIARRIYPTISAKLKAELGRDRERAGMITGLHR